MKKLWKRISDWFHAPLRQRMRFVYGFLALAIAALIGYGSYSVGDWNGSRTTSKKVNAHYSKKMKKLYNEYKHELRKAEMRVLNAKVYAVILRDINQDRKPDVILLRNNGKRELLPCALKGGRPVCHHPVGGGKYFQKELERMKAEL